MYLQKFGIAISKKTQNIKFIIYYRLTRLHWGMKRMVFDKIRQGDISEANNIFDTMQKIYELIFPFAEFDKVIPGIRKKTDVARTLIESVRVTITEESRRNEMIKKLNKK